MRFDIISLGFAAVFMLGSSAVSAELDTAKSLVRSTTGEARQGFYKRRLHDLALASLNKRLESTGQASWVYDNEEVASLHTETNSVPKKSAIERRAYRNKYRGRGNRKMSRNRKSKHNRGRNRKNRRPPARHSRNRGDRYDDDSDEHENENENERDENEADENERD
ncbi:hypothetical protein EDC96DRAFT_492532, partial [Choanephora cucurbitarum]